MVMHALKNATTSGADASTQIDDGVIAGYASVEMVDKQAT